MSDKERADRATELLRRFFEEFKGPDNMSDDSQICREIEVFLNPPPPLPDFREPWSISRQYVHVVDVKGHTVDRKDYTRIVACVNACKGMRDPEREIAELRAAADATKAK